MGRSLDSGAGDEATPGQDRGSLGFPAELYEQLPESVAVYGRDGRCLYVNRTTEQMLGKPRAELLGRVLWEVFPESIGNQIPPSLRPGRWHGRS